LLELLRLISDPDCMWIPDRISAIKRFYDPILWIFCLGLVDWYDEILLGYNP
jgi:hypothetical protein